MPSLVGIDSLIGVEVFCYSVLNQELEKGRWLACTWARCAIERERRLCQWAAVVLERFVNLAQKQNLKEP